MADAYPLELRYTKSDEWVRREGDMAVTGITSYAAEQLGDVVFLQLPAVGSTYARGDSLGEIESVKAVSDLYAPVGGEIVATNEELDQQPGLVNDDPYGRGWLVHIRVTDVVEIDALLDAGAYAHKVSESH